MGPGREPPHRRGRAQRGAEGPVASPAEARSSAAHRCEEEALVKVHEYDAPFARVVETLISNVEESGLLLVADIDVQKNARRTGMEIGGNRILLVFRPDYTVRVWEAEIEAGVDIPVHIHVREMPDGRVQARYRPPSETFAPYGNAELSEIGGELDPVFEGIVDTPLRREVSP